MFKEWASFVIIAVEQLNLFLSCLCLLWHKRSVTPHWEILILERINYKLRYSIYNNQTLCLNRWMIWYFHIMVSFLKVISNVFCRWKYPLNTDNLQVLSKHLLLRLEIVFIYKLLKQECACAVSKGVIGML